MKTFLFVLLAVLIAFPAHASEISVEFGSGSGKAAYINQKSNPGEDNVIPIGPLSFRATENQVWIADTVSNKFLVFSQDGTIQKEISFGEPAEKILCEDFALSFNEDKSVSAIWIINGYNGRLEKLSSEGKRLAEIAFADFIQPMRLEIDSLGNLLVTDDGAQKIFVFDNQGKNIGSSDYEWSGIATSNEASSFFALRFDQEKQISFLVKRSFAGKASEEVALELGRHFNPHLWWLDSESSEMFISYKTEADQPGQFNLARVGIDGKVRGVSAFKTPVALTRFIDHQNFQKIWLAEADYGKAPEGKLVIRTITLP
ncbi:MAG: hypothetical protein AB1403_06760 [Candidatus Riflebacteria bacterium]